MSANTTATIEWTGMASIDRTLADLDKKQAKRIGRAAMTAGLGELRKSVRKEAPRGKTGVLRKSIGSRFAKGRKTKVMEAKAGINVGKKRQSKAFAFHGAIIGAGTSQRANKRGQNRGSVDGNNFVERGVNFAKHRVLPAMSKKAAQQLERIRAKR